MTQQMKRKAAEDSKLKRNRKYTGNVERMISTGSTLLDLAISGGRVRGGGIPGGVFVEIFGPSGSGKTVLLCEIAGAIKRQGGEVMFKDPEARLNKKFARLFDLDVDHIDYEMPTTVPEVFTPVRGWKPKNLNKVNGIFADSLAALSTEMELDDKDQYGMRRAKEFSEELRKTCRTITQKNFLMVASNQLRENVGGGSFSPKHKSPGGKAIEFYSSLRLKMSSPIKKIKRVIKVAGKEVERIKGITVEALVEKSSVWAPYHKAPLTILFDYGIDDIRQNLQYIKDYTDNKIYTINGESLDKSINRAIMEVEEDDREEELRNEVIDLWCEIEEKLKQDRKPKKR